MKKFYTLVLVAIAATFAANAGIAKTESELAGKLQPSSNFTEKFAGTLDGDVTISRQSKAETLSATPKAAPTGEWNSIGMGTWYEDLLTVFSDIESDQSWPVEIFESATTPNYYRVTPYVADSPIAKFLGKADETTIFYFDATNPDKVFVDGDVKPYNLRTFSQLVPENGWTSYNKYGTFIDKVISFPTGSFVYNSGTGWYLGLPKEGKFKVALPGAVVKDYTFKATSPLCSTDNKITISLTKGADIATVKYMWLRGFYTCAGNNANVVAANGSVVSSNNMNVEITEEDAGLNSMLLAAVDASGNVVASAARHFYGIYAPADDWGEEKTATYHEGILSGSFSDVDEEDIEVTVQESESNPGLYRINNPYAKHTVFGEFFEDHSAGHEHSMYINATNPEAVTMASAPMGIKYYSFGGFHIIAPDDYYVGQDVSSLNGKMDSTGKVTFPDGAFRLGAHDYSSPAIGTSKNLYIQLPDPSGVNGIDADDNNAAVEYYNMQGIKIANPENGIFIMKQGNKVVKVVK